MKLIEKWEDLNGLENGRRGLKIEVHEADEDKCYFSASLTDDDEYDIWLGSFSKNDFSNLIKKIYKFGFDVEYKKPFDLVEFLKNNLKPSTTDTVDGDEFHFCISYENGGFDVYLEENDSCIKHFGEKHFRLRCLLDGFNNKLRQNNLKEEEFNSAMKELGWL